MTKLKLMVITGPGWDDVSSPVSGTHFLAAVARK